MTPASRAPAAAPLYVIETDDGRLWEFYECGLVRFYDSHEDIEEWALLADYETGRE
jgi:hypothetical protein